MNITLRFAQVSDIEALTQIGIAAFPFEPQWPYRYPHRKQYPEEHYKHTKIRYTEWLAAATAKQCMIMVAEAPSIEDLAVRKVVALSIWRLPPQFEDRDDNHKLKPPKPKHSRYDANARHMEAYREAVGRGQAELFDKIYGERQLSLAQLATHPDYFRNGAGTMLVKWGLAFAERESWAVTVFAGPKAYSLYKRLGFRELGEVKAQAEGEEEFIKFPGLGWEPRIWLKKT